MNSLMIISNGRIKERYARMTELLTENVILCIMNLIKFITYTGTMFQSYDSNIVFVAQDHGKAGIVSQVFLDERYWDWSKTTGKYRNDFLGEGIAETRKKIESGEYKLVNLN